MQTCIEYPGGISDRSEVGIDIQQAANNKMIILTKPLSCFTLKHTFQDYLRY